MARPYVALRRKQRRHASWAFYWPDADSYGAVNLGRYVIHFGMRRG